VNARDHLGLARDEQFAKSLPGSLAALDVEHTIRCPTCRRSGRRFLSRHGSDARGHQRWRCKHCKSTFRDRPITQRQAEHCDRMRLASLLRGLVDHDGLPIHKAAKKARVGRRRAQRLYDWHSARWPKKPALL
jgi:transposase-like protein